MATSSANEKLAMMVWFIGVDSGMGRKGGGEAEKAGWESYGVGIN
jgi:hypothetical protein